MKVKECDEKSLKYRENSADKKVWVAPEVSDYDYASLTKGGANLGYSADDTSGNNYSAS